MLTVFRVQEKLQKTVSIDKISVFVVVNVGLTIAIMLLIYKALHCRKACIILLLFGPS